MSAGGGASSWQRVLWDRRQRAYADTHTPAAFLGALVVNAAVCERAYWPTVLGAVAVVQELAVTALVAAANAHLRSGALSARALLAVDAALLVVGACARVAVGAARPRALLAASAREGALLVVGVGGLAPLYQTLASTISGDTLVVCVVMLFVAHLVLHDYSYLNSATTRLTGSLGLGAAVFSSGMLASRLPTPTHVFAAMTLSLELFVLSPFVRADLRRSSTPGYVALTAAAVAAAAAALVPLGALPSGAFLALAAFVALACPRVLVGLQSLKCQINGPWDEAKVPADVLRDLHALVQDLEARDASRRDRR